MGLGGGDPAVGVVLVTLAAAMAALERGAVAEALGHMHVATQQTVQIATPPTPPATRPPPPVVAVDDEPLDIKAVATLTGYSVQRLREMGHTLPGWKKWPGGKVTWWKRQLLAGIHRP